MVTHEEQQHRTFENIQPTTTCTHTAAPPKNGVVTLPALDEDGIVAPGQIIHNHDIYVNKQTPMNTSKGIGRPLTDRCYKDSPAIYKGVDGETTVVDRVMLCPDTNDKLSIKCIIRHTRRPEI
ncbi:unnamed protein product [Miscanthus lutarioriparius]|uniref:DNA-directed RNA polymerase subunit 2 hybrid-binding domain-containing protein n=1 Tax=Miscanthus lutarioriparius TaxID=422564 RepID=A0A811S8S4_9POAL|nr:unnamed protein product [Miscanthus lutarioriparius]